MSKTPETQAELRAAYDELVVEVARLHKCTGRGDHGPMGNLRCALDAVFTMRESYGELERERKELEQDRNELRRKLGAVCDQLTDIVTAAGSSAEPVT